jgi:hypothetical protein
MLDEASIPAIANSNCPHIRMRDGSYASKKVPFGPSDGPEANSIPVRNH